eukprot:TRINITY_DN16197_c0_g2_i6.p1 TRINITY_DN16197_c0_g2~~TRINITY_DN16197_c0_g2_i6.p1  ORF type:complete len:5681 (+),score=1481.21 TRINITY_DN16197_c0_g2_i6:2374-17043(+)
MANASAECLYNGKPRSINSLIYPAQQAPDGTYETEAYSPVAFLSESEATFSGFAYAALEPGYETNCFRLLVRLKRDVSVPQVYSCTPAVSQQLISQLGITMDEYSTVEGMSDRIVIAGSRLAFVSQSETIKVKAGELFGVQVSPILAGNIKCWEKPSACKISYKVIMQQVSEPAIPCPKCGKEVFAGASLLVSFNLLSFNVVGTYTFAFWGKSADVALAPAYLTVVVTPDVPAAVSFVGCPVDINDKTHIAGSPFERITEVLDKYGNPVTGWKNPITVSAEYDGKVVNETLDASKLVLRRATEMGKSYTLVASSSGPYGSSNIELAPARCADITVLPDKPVKCRATVITGSYDSAIVKAGADFTVRVQFFDMYDNKAQKVSQAGHVARLSLLSDAKGMLRGVTDRDVSGAQVVFSGLSYDVAPDTIRVAVVLDGIEGVSTCVAEAVQVIPDDPSELKITGIRKASSSEAVNAIIGGTGTEVGSPLVAGEKFCIKLSITDRFGNIVDESDPAIKARYRRASEQAAVSGLPSFVPPEEHGDLLDSAKEEPIIGASESAADKFLRLMGSGQSPFLDPLSGMGGRRPPGQPFYNTMQQIPITPTTRKVQLSRKDCIYGRCKGDDELKGTTVMEGLGGVFEFCDVWYERSECFNVEASSEGLASDASGKICVDHAAWAELRCDSDVRRVSLNQPMGTFVGTLLDRFGNEVKDCERDQGDKCVVRIREMEGGHGYTPGGMLTDSTGVPGVLIASNNPQGNIVAVPSRNSGILRFENLYYTRERPQSDPLRLELVGPGNIRAVCSGEGAHPIVVVSYHTVCIDVPSEVTAGDAFVMSGDISAYSRSTGQYEAIACPGDVKCSSKLYLSASGGSSSKELTRFAFSEGARGAAAATPDCSAFTDEVACSSADPLCEWGIRASQPFAAATPLCHTNNLTGIAAVNGVLTFSNLAFYKAGIFNPVITPKPPATSLDEYASVPDTLGDEKLPPGECSAVKVVAAAPYEMCLGSSVGMEQAASSADALLTMPNMQFPAADTVASISNLVDAAQCADACAANVKCARWTFTTGTGLCELKKVGGSAVAAVGYVSGCSDNYPQDTACSSALPVGGCEKCIEEVRGECGTCPAKTVLAGQPLNFVARVHDLWGNIAHDRNTDNVAVTCRVIDGPAANSKHEARLYPWASMRMTSASFDDGLVGVASLTTPRLNVAGKYTISCWADVRLPTGEFLSGLPTTTNPNVPGGVVWTPVLKSDSFEISPAQFLRMVNASPNRVIKRSCPSCPSIYHRVIYVKILTRATSALYERLKSTWVDPSNVAGTDYTLHATYEDAIKGSNPWTFCESAGTVCTTLTTRDQCNANKFCFMQPSDTTCRTKEVGFPGWCAPSQAASSNNWNTWNRDLEPFTRATDVEFAIETAPSCSERNGKPTNTTQEFVDRTDSLQACVALVKETYHGMDELMEASGASWFGGKCYAEFSNGEDHEQRKAEWTFSQVEPNWRSCQFPVVNTYIKTLGGCMCDGVRCPCSAPLASNPRLRKDCEVQVLPSEPSSLECITRSADLYAGSSLQVQVALRDEFANRRTGVFGPEVRIYAEGGTAANGGLQPMVPRAPLEAGVATVRFTYATAEDVTIQVETDVRGLEGRRFWCPAVAGTEVLGCCSNMRACPERGMLAVCPTDVAGLIFLSGPGSDVACGTEGSVVANRRFPPIKVGVYDMFGNLKNLDGLNVTLSVATDGADGSIPTGRLGRTLSQLTINGVATFDDISYSKAESIILRAGTIETDTVSGKAVRTIYRSNRITRVCPGDICRLELKHAPSTCTFDAANNDPIVVSVQDSMGNTLESDATGSCRVVLSVGRSDTITNYTWLTDSSLIPTEAPMEWHRVSATAVATNETDFRTEYLERSLYMHTVTREGGEASESFVVYGGATVLPGLGTTGDYSDVLAAKSPSLPAGAPSLRNNVWRFNMRTTTWTKLWSPPSHGIFPPARFGHTAVSVQSKVGLKEAYLFVFGGRTESPACCDNKLWRFGPLYDASGPKAASAMSWTQLDISGGPLSLQLAHSTAVAFGQKMYVFSGIGGDSTVDMVNTPVAGPGGSNQLFVIDLRDALTPTVTSKLYWSKVKLAAGSPLPRGRVQASSVLYGSTWYVVGGALWPRAGAFPTPTNEVWSLDLLDLETPESTMWMLESASGPGLVGGSIALDSVHKQVLMFGGSPLITGQFGEKAAATAANKVSRYSIENRAWLDEDQESVAVGVAGCVSRIGLEWSSVATVGSDPIFTTSCSTKKQSECQAGAGVCSTYTTRAACLSDSENSASDGWRCGWDSVTDTCYEGCIWRDASADYGVVPGKKTFAAAANGQIYKDPADGQVKAYFFGGAAAPSPESRYLCQNGVACTSDPDVWSVGPITSDAKEAQRPLAWDVSERCVDPDTTAEFSNCYTLWKDKSACTAAVSNVSATNANCLWTTVMHQCSSADGSGCATVTGTTSAITNSEATFDRVIFSSTRNLPGQLQYCQAKVSSNQATCDQHSDTTSCSGDALCFWQTQRLTKTMKTQLRASLVCSSARPGSCNSIEPIDLPLMTCARCQLAVLPDSAPRTGARATLAGKDLIGTGSMASPYPEHDLGKISVGITGANGVLLDSVTAAEVSGSTSIELKVSRATPFAALNVTVPRVSVSANAVTYQGKTIPGAVFDSVEFSSSSAPVTMWVTAQHYDGVCQDSEPWPVNVVPDEACDWLITHPTTVKAGDSFTVEVLIKDSLGNIAYCGVQQNTWRIAYAQPISSSLLASADECEALCDGTPKCMMWNYAAVDITVAAEVVQSRTCRLYNNVGYVPRNGMAKVEGAASGVTGSVPCFEGAYLKMEAVAPSSTSDERVKTLGTLYSESRATGSSICYLSQTLSLLEATNRQACLSCCRDSSSPFIVEHWNPVTNEYRCGCVSTPTQKEWTDSNKCEGMAPNRLGYYIKVTELITEFRQEIVEHDLRFDALWHNRAEKLVLMFEHSIRTDCPIRFSKEITVTPAEPHHLNEVDVPAWAHASMCGPDDAFQVEFEIVDFWNNRVNVAHRVILQLHRGTGYIDAEPVVSQAGLVAFEVAYSIAEQIELLVIDLDIAGDSWSPPAILADNLPQCGMPCYGDSCKYPTPAQCCEVTRTIDIMTGPAYKLVTVEQPPAKPRSFASGDCESFTYTVELQDTCGNRITEKTSGEYYEMWSDVPLDIQVVSRNMELYSGDETPADYHWVLSDPVLRDGQAVIEATYSKADCGVTFVVSVGDMEPAMPNEICVTHCVPDHLEIIEPAACHDPTLSLPFIGAGAPLPPITVAVLDADDNVCDSPSPLSYRRLGCFKDQSSTALPYQISIAPSMFSINACMEACEASGYNRFGLQRGTMCFCGEGTGYARYGETEELECTTPCAGGEDKNCGGVGVNAVYEILSSYANIQLSSRDYKLHDVIALDPRMSVSRTAGDGGNLVGGVSMPARKGLAVLQAVWLPDAGIREACKASPPPINCTGQVTIQAIDTTLSVQSDTCNVEVKRDRVVCPSVPIKTRVGQRFDIWSYIMPATGSIDPSIAELKITVFDEHMDLEMDPAAAVTATNGYYTQTFAKANVPLAEATAAVFSNLYYTSRIPVGEASVVRRLRVQSDYSQECTIEVDVYAGYATQCTVTPPASRDCLLAGEPFNVGVELKDDVGNRVLSDNLRCLTRVTGLDCPVNQNMRSAVPQNLQELDALTDLFNPNLPSEFVKISVGTRRRGGALELFAEDSMLYVSDLAAQGQVPWDTVPSDMNLLAEQVAKGTKCIALAKSIVYPTSTSAASFSYNWQVVECSALTDILCVDTVQRADCPRGVTSPVSVATISLVGELSGEGGVDELDTKPTAAQVGYVEFIGLQYTRAAVSRTFAVSATNYVGANMTGCMDQQFTLAIAPGRPRRLASEIRPEEPVSEGVVCISCSPHDQFSIMVRALDEYGNLASWECPGDQQIHAADLVGFVNIQVVSGAGKLITSSGDGVPEAAWPGKKLEEGIILFDSLRYDTADTPVFHVNVREWSASLGGAPPGPTESLRFHACFPWTLEISSIPDEVVAGKPFRVDVAIKDRYGNVLTLDPFGLVSSRDPVINFQYLLPEHNVAPHDAVPIDDYIGDPGRYTYMVTQTRVVWQVKDVIMDATGDTVQVLVRVNPKLIADFGLLRSTIDASGLTCRMSPPGYLRDLQELDLYHNEPVQLVQPENDMAVEFDQPFAIGVRTKQLDRFNNLAWDEGDRYGVVGCKLERNYVKSGSIEDTLYAAPTSDQGARVELRVSGTLATFDPAAFIADFATIADVDPGTVTIVSISEVTNDPALASAAHTRSLLTVQTYLLIIVQVNTPYASRVVGEYVDFVTTASGNCTITGSTDDCCVRSAHNQLTCIGGSQCTTNCMLADPKQKIMPGEAPIAAPEENSNFTASSVASRRLSQFQSTADTYFALHELQRGLTNALLTPNPVSGDYPKKEYFVPQLLMGMKTDLGSDLGSSPYHDGHLWFKDSFTRMMDGVFTLMTTCERLSPGEVGKDDPLAPEMYRVETGVIAVVPNKLDIIKTPGANTCRRAGDSFSYTVRALLATGESLPTAPAPTHLSIYVAGQSQKLGPFMCDNILALSKGEYEATCTVNTANAPLNQPAGGVGVNRAEIWTTTDPITEVTVQQDAATMRVFATDSIATTLGFIPACASTLAVYDQPPLQVAVHKPFTVGLQLEDKYGNIGGSYTVRVVAYSADPTAGSNWPKAVNPAATVVDLRSSLLDGGSQYNDAPTVAGRLQYNDLYVEPSFLQNLGSGSEGYIWLVAYVLPSSGTGCDAGCDSYSPVGAACSAAGSVLSTEFGCLHHVFTPILVTPDVPALCEFLQYPSYFNGGMTAGPMYGETFKARILDKYGIPIHELSPASSATLVLLQGTAQA